MKLIVPSNQPKKELHDKKWRREVTDKPITAVGEKILSKHNVLRDDLLSLYGRMGMLTEMQSYIQKEICETSNEIGHIKSLLKERVNER